MLRQFQVTHAHRKRYLVPQKYAVVFKSNIISLLKVIVEQLCPEEMHIVGFPHTSFLTLSVSIHHLYLL